MTYTYTSLRDPLRVVANPALEVGAAIWSPVLQSFGLLHFVCDDVWITENKKYFQNARFLL